MCRKSPVSYHRWCHRGRPPETKSQQEIERQVDNNKVTAWQILFCCRCTNIKWAVDVNVGVQEGPQLGKVTTSASTNVLKMKDYLTVLVKSLKKVLDFLKFKKPPP